MHSHQGSGNNGFWSTVLCRMLADSIPTLAKEEAPLQFGMEEL